jgi:hypothetical protein
MNLVVNSTQECKIPPIEGKILSTAGRVEIFDIQIPPYPKLIHLSTLDTEMIAQKKINGYNVRLVYIPKLSNFLAVLRGGFICAKTTFMLRQNYSKLFMNFFKDYPKNVLVMEVLGRKSLANIHINYYKKSYGFEDIGYFVFDIMDLRKPEGERFLPFSKVKSICEKYKLQLVPTIGTFKDMDALNKAMNDLPIVFEGAVVKSLDGKTIMKYRFDTRPDLFKGKIPEKKKAKRSPEEIIVAHFFQGYGEPELGLKEGISVEEMEEYQKLLEESSQQIKVNIEKVVEFIMDCITQKGTFDNELNKKIKKLVLKKVIGATLRGMKKFSR